MNSLDELLQEIENYLSREDLQEMLVHLLTSPPRPITVRGKLMYLLDNFKNELSEEDVNIIEGYLQALDDQANGPVITE